MKIIFSRKGFDSSWGGHPNLILPDGRLVLLPIPAEDNIRYSDLKFSDQKTYYDIMKELDIEKIKLGNKSCRLTKEQGCHLDPDLDKDIFPRQDSHNWRPSLGQVDQAQAHLENQGVKEGDLFLFFAWFKEVEYRGGKFRYKRSALDRHIIFGYLQVGGKLAINQEFKNTYPWLSGHPHIVSRDKYGKNNTLYIARETVTWNNSIPGGGILSLNDNIVLTQEGRPRSQWELPDFFKKLRITYHSFRSWRKEGYFQSALIGQEFVVEDNSEAEKWAQNLIQNNANQ